MQYCEFNLRKDVVNGFMPTLKAYIIDDASKYPERRKIPAVLVCPGGGYALCSIREGEPIALQYMAAGYCAFVLDYCVAPANCYPESLKDISAAMQLIREHADEWGIDKDKIAVIGFSAGGHLAASLATMWDEEPIKTKDGSNRPNAVILSYPVISSKKGVAHEASFDNLCRDDAKLREYVSLENRVNDKTPPCFLWHTFTDASVPVENSLLFAMALKKAGVSCEMHIFPEGRHGLSLANSTTAAVEEQIVKRAQDWVPLSVNWLNDLFDKEKFGN